MTSMLLNAQCSVEVHTYVHVQHSPQDCRKLRSASTLSTRPGRVCGTGHRGVMGHRIFE